MTLNLLLLRGPSLSELSMVFRGRFFVEALALAEASVAAGTSFPEVQS